MKIMQEIDLTPTEQIEENRIGPNVTNFTKKKHTVSPLVLFAPSLHCDGFGNKACSFICLL